MKRILVVEDEPGVRNELVEILKDLGTIDQAGTLQQAVHLFSDHVYALVLVDLWLPDGSGQDLLVQIQELPEPPATVVVSSTLDVKARNRCLQLGAKDFISKPFHPAEAAKRVTRALNLVNARIETPGSTLEAPEGSRRVHINTSEGYVVLDGKRRRLNLQEAQVLEVLRTSPGRPFHLDDLGRAVLGSRYRSPVQVSRLIRRLRRKLQSRPGDPQIIVDVPPADENGPDRHVMFRNPE